MSKEIDVTDAHPVAEEFNLEVKGLKEKRPTVAEQKSGSETNTWAVITGLIGSLIGLSVGLFVLMALSNHHDISNESNTAFASRSYLAWFVAPMIGFLFGGFAGVLVGIGIPRWKDNPQQGKKRRLRLARRNN